MQGLVSTQRPVRGSQHAQPVLLSNSLLSRFFRQPMHQPLRLHKMILHQPVTPAITTEPSASMKRSKVQKIPEFTPEENWARENLNFLKLIFHQNLRMKIHQKLRMKIHQSPLKLPKKTLTKCFPSLEKPWKKTSGMLFSTFWKTSFC